MTVPAGTHAFGADRDRLLLRTSRDGLAAQAGHDLVIEMTRWSGDLTIAADGMPTALRARLDLHSLAVREGTGGLKPLTDRDKREIAITAGKTLNVQRYPEATFEATAFEAGRDGGGTITGTLTLGGESRPVRLQVSENGPGRYHASVTVQQTDFGIKPYTGFFGALKVSDQVGVEADVDLSQAGS